MYLVQKTITTKMLQFNKTIIKKMYISHKIHQQGYHHKNIPVSQDHHTENIPVSKDHHITIKMYLFHKTIAINRTCLTKPISKIHISFTRPLL